MKCVTASLFIFLSWSALAADLVVYTESSPPYQYENEEGNVAGSATEKVKAIINAAGLNARYELYPWARAINLSKKNPKSVIFSMARLPEREQDFIVIAPVVRFDLALVGLADNKDIVINDWAVLNNYSIAVQRDDIAFFWLQQLGLKENEQIFVCADIQCSWQHLLRGTVDLMIEDPALIAPTAKRFGVDASRIAPVKFIPELSVQGYLAANRRMDPAIVARLQRAAQSLK